MIWNRKFDMYEYKSRVRLTEVDQNQKMTLNAVLNYFQDCSTFQSEDSGVGVKFLEKRNRMWVLCSWKIVICRYPELAETIEVATWPYAFGKIAAQRNFRMLDKDGNMAAYADSLWAYMDTARMRPTKIDEDIVSAYQKEEKLDMEYEANKIMIPENLESKSSFVIHNYHLDVNHHVNNGQYVQLAEEYLPDNFSIHQMRAEYKKSALLGDVIYPKVKNDRDTCTVILGDKSEKPYAVVEFK